MPYPYYSTAAPRPRPLTPEDKNQMAGRALEDEFAATAQRESEAAGTRGESLGMIRGYDPMEYARGVGQATYADIKDDERAADYQRKTSLNRRGLFGSNLGGARDERFFTDRFARALAGQGFQAASLEGQNINRMMGMYETDVGRAEAGRDRSLDFLSGERDRDVAEANARREAESRKVPWWKQALDIGTGAVGLASGLGWLGGKK